MTDKEIIQSFLDNNQRGIREAYYAWRMPFEQSLTRLLPNTDDMDDAYQEAFIRLQQHILTERLTADNIEKSLLAYLKLLTSETRDETEPMKMRLRTLLTSKRSWNSRMIWTTNHNTQTNPSILMTTWIPKSVSASSAP